MKKIGILWGMWPQASINFCNILLEKTKNFFPFPRNDSFPFFMLSSIPVKDLIHSRKDEQDTVNFLKQEAQNLHLWGASFIVMTCNTMHIFEKEIFSWINTPFVSMIDSVVKKVRNQHKTIGLLWSGTTMTSWLYKDPLKEIWVCVIIPEEKNLSKISDTIQKIIWWTYGEVEREFLKSICLSLVDSGAEAIILWCTELPLVVKDGDFWIQFYSSLDILADEVMDLYYK